jgi:hypothetical protein
MLSVCGKEVRIMKKLIFISFVMFFSVSVSAQQLTGGPNQLTGGQNQLTGGPRELTGGANQLTGQYNLTGGGQELSGPEQSPVESLEPHMAELIILSFAKNIPELKVSFHSYFYGDDQPAKLYLTVSRIVGTSVQTNMPYEVFSDKPAIKLEIGDAEKIVISVDAKTQDDKLIAFDKQSILLYNATLPVPVKPKLISAPKK